MATITIHCKTIYGAPAYYPACPASHELLNLTGKKTFSKADLATINRLGYGIDYFADTPRNVAPLAAREAAAMCEAP